MWFDLNDGDDERGVYELGDELELVLLGSGVWLWRDARGNVLDVPIVGES